MSKEESIIEVEGLVVEVLPNAFFRVKLDNGHILVTHVSGNLRKNRIRIRAEDKVKVEMSVYDLTKGRISKRLS